MRKFDVVLFDLGSTLVFFDSPRAEVSTFSNQELADTLIQLGYPLPKDEFIQEFAREMQVYYDIRSTEYVEKTTECVLKDLLEEWGYRDVPPEHLRQALNAMYAVSQQYWKREEDAIPTLDRLLKLGFRLGAISNASDGPDVHKIMEQNGLGSYFEQLLISAEVGFRKPHRKIFQMALEYFQVSPERAVMVGDTLEADVLGAKQSGITSVWITRRVNDVDARARELSAHPDAVIAALDELPSLLQHWPG
jgi:putative hydrolase of the HAD superfamily